MTASDEDTTRFEERDSGIYNAEQIREEFRELLYGKATAPSSSSLSETAGMPTSEALAASMTEAEKVAEYERLRADGLSDSEARGTLWPEPPAPADLLDYAIALQRIMEAVMRAARGESAAIPDSAVHAAPHHAKLGASVIAALAASRSEGQQDRDDAIRWRTMRDHGDVENVTLSSGHAAYLMGPRVYTDDPTTKMTADEYIDAARTAVAQPETET